jgi:hypothetical protein
MLPALREALKEHGAETLQRALHRLQHHAPAGAIRVIMPPETAAQPYSRTADQPVLAARTVQRQVPDDWKISSFSYLVSGLAHDYLPERLMMTSPAGNLPALMILTSFPEGLRPAAVCMIFLSGGF